MYANTSEQQTNLLQKFLSRLGENSLVRPVPNDQHSPDLSGIWSPVFQTNKTTGQIVSSLKLGDSIAGQSAITVDVDYIESKIGKRGLASGL